MGLVRNLVLYLPVQLMTVLSGFGSVYLLTRMLGPTSYGYYALVVSGMMLVQTITMSWMEASAFRFYPRAQARGRLGDLLHSLRDAWWKSGLVLWLGSVALLLVAPVADEVQWAGLVAVTASLGAALTNVQLEIWRAAQLPVRYSLSKAGHMVLLFAGTIIGAVWMPNAVGAMLGYAVGALVSGAAAMVTLGLAWQKGRARRRLTRAFFAFGWPLSVVLILDIALSAGDRFMIGALLTAADVGSYAAAYGIADKSIMALFSWAGLAASPFLMRAFDLEGREAAQQVARQAASIFLAVGAPAALGVAMIAAPLNSLMIAEDMAATATLLTPWIAAGAFFNGFVVYYLAFAFELTRNTVTQAKCIAIAACVNIGLNLVLLPQMGVVGAAVATLLSYGFAAALIYWEGRRHYRLPLPLGEALRIAPALAVMAGVIFWLPTPIGWGGLLFTVTLAAGAYGLVAFAFNALGLRQWCREKLVARATAR